MMEQLIACTGCDLLVDVDDVPDGARANCPRCGHFLTHHRSDADHRALAYGLAAMISLVLACSFPFLSFSARGLSSAITLPRTPLALWEYGQPAVALLVAAFIIVIPAVVLVLLLALCTALGNGLWRPWLVPVGRWLFFMRNWAMVEVFIIGVLVSLVKISSMAQVQLGSSFFAYVAFTILFILAVTSLDRYQCWIRIERLGPASVE